MKRGVYGQRAIATALITMLASAPGAAAAPMPDSAIPAQGLAGAIRAIARRAGVNILFLADTVAGRRSSAVRGKSDPLTTLRMALRAHPDLEAVALPDGTLLVRLRSTPAPANPSPPPARRTPLAVKDPPPQGDLVVTAMRRPTLLRDYSGTLTVLAGKEVAKSGRTTLAEASELIPGLNLTQTGPGQRRITMRGIQSAGENSVLLYLDEAPVSGPSSATSDVSQMSPDIRLYDVERVEVLRGPQGTLFGSGALGGAVRILFAKPQMNMLMAETAGGARVVEGGAPGFTLRTTINVPLIPDILALRATAYDERRGGIVDNIALHAQNVDSARTSGGRLAVRMAPGSDLEVIATLLLQRQRVADSSAWFPAVGRYRTSAPARLPFPNDLSLQSVVGQWNGGKASITGALSHYRWNVNRNIDSSRPALGVIADGTYCPLYAAVASCDAAQLAGYRNYVAQSLPLVGNQPMHVAATTAELRVALTPDGPLAVTSGLFLERRSDSSRSGTFGADPVTGDIVPERRIFLRTVAVETRQSAIFADASIRLPGAITLMTGARLYRYGKVADSQVIQTSYINGAVAGDAARREVRSNGWTGRVNLAWRPATPLLLYGQIATGFRPGGVNSVPNLPEALIAFDSDSATSCEAGLRWNDDAITLSAAGYWIDWRNMQANARLPSFIFVSNSGAARIVGLDLDMEARVAPDWRVRGSLSLLDARLTRDQSNPVVAAPGRKGDRIPFEPSVKAVLSAQYQHAWRDGIDLTAGVDIAYVGTSFSEYRPTSEFYERMGNYADMTLRWGVEHPRWSLTMTITNALGVIGRQRVESMAYAEQQTVALTPRAIGIDFSWRFLSREK